MMMDNGIREFTSDFVKEVGEFDSTGPSEQELRDQLDFLKLS